MTKYNLFWLLTAILLTVTPLTHAQQPTKTPRVGWLSGAAFSTIATRMEAFRQGLRELGYVEGKNIIVEWRAADGNVDHLATLAAELVRLKVEVIVTGGPIVTRAAKEATQSIPIVMTNEFDPVGTGFVASLAHPGGNITGLSTLAPELSGKRLELLKEILPKLTRVAVFGTSTVPGYAQARKEIELAANEFKVQLQFPDILRAKDIPSAFRAASKGRAEAVIYLASGSVTSNYRTELLDLAVKNRLPVIYPGRSVVEAGGLMSYGVSQADLDRRSATYVDKILNGRKPADLPVEQPKKFEFIVNLKAAKAIGLTIPPNVLVRADRVIR